MIAGLAYIVLRAITVAGGAPPPHTRPVPYTPSPAIEEYRRFKEIEARERAREAIRKKLQRLEIVR